jgi:hypothetical protein
MANAEDRSSTTESRDEVPEGGAFSAPVEAEEGQDRVRPAPESLEDVEKQKERLEEARAAMWKEGEEGNVPGTGVQEEETARVAESVAFPGTGVRQFQEASNKDELEEAVEDLRVKQEEAESAFESSDRIPPADWPPKDDSSG